MTTWIENPTGGRARGPRGLVRAWAEVLLRPGRFFRNGVSPGDQAPGLTFAMAVAVAFTAGWFLVDPTAIPGIVGSAAASAAVTLVLVGVLAAPVGLHLTAVAGVIAAIVASLRRTATGSIGTADRGGVSETVQVVAYASAPFALAGPPLPALRVACTIYATGLLVIGFRRIHGLSWPRTVIASLPPAVIGFGFGYRSLFAFRALAGW
ncbi:YIP1 family protein [Halopenitus sp. POP-27]|uniref:YIP1 family protein n=1 Tax=Halopenitus sp. POP-27 TaxID=2994425 RepID=UPI002468759F|nr:YIP1 family protein [Halopenitus sp. POP-27]